MICYAVIDTNVLVSALLSDKDDAATVQVVGKVISGEIIPVYSNVITKEYREVLSRKKFGFSGDLIEYLMSAIEKYGILVDPSPSGITLPDMKDVPFYEVVLEKRSDNTYLVTGNIRHFPKEPFVVTPREFLDILNAK
ncbi:MAG: putative toxin-antitoxin system toxin component, PIN family [Lachnospiraceae bacterium]|nr:putative toxin-antitoxin system toxin component, PIN family [Lachnospiraceae bacterium]